MIFRSHIQRTGFTLIEMIVAVAIFGVIASIVFPALIQFLDVRERVDEQHQKVVGLQKTFLFLAQDLRYAANRLGKNEFGDLGKATVTVGDDSLIDFTASYPDLNLQGLNVPRRVRWILEEGVIQRIQSPVMDPDNDTRTFRQRLLGDVEEVELELSVVEDGNDKTSKKWEEQTRLPDMVTVTITLNNGVEYKRSFTMLGGDTLAAIEQANNQAAADNAGNGAGTGGAGGAGGTGGTGGTGGGGATGNGNDTGVQNPDTENQAPDDEGQASDDGTDDGSDDEDDEDDDVFGEI